MLTRESVQHIGGVCVQRVTRNDEFSSFSDTSLGSIQWAMGELYGPFHKSVTLS